MRRILTFALLAGFALAATVPVSLVTAGKAEATTPDRPFSSHAHSVRSTHHR